MPASEPEYEALSPERSSAEGCDRATGVECSSSPDGDPSTPMSPAVLLRRSRGSDDDMWEALDFQPQAQGTRETWTLGPEFLSSLALEPALRTRLLNLQAQLSRALQEIDKLRGTVSLLHREASMASLRDAVEPEAPEPLWKPAWDGFRRGFTLTYFVRAGLGLSTRALQLLRQRKWQDLKGWNLLSEKGFTYREDAVRLGLFIGGFTSIYALVHAFLERRPEQATHAQACLIAGTAAGLTLIFQDAERRRTLALYMAARVAQCFYNSMKAKGRWSILSSSLGPRYGDSLLFALATSQVMYAFVMRPKLLPHNYWNFIVRTGPIHGTVLEAVRQNVRGEPVDVDKVNAFIRGHGGSRLLTNPYPRQIPSWVLHPGTPSALLNVWRTFAGSFRRTFPLYFSLSVVPFAVLNLKRALRDPLRTVFHAFTGSVRSTSFIAAFTALYMASISAHRKVSGGDFKQLYWLAGVVASSAIFIEKKARRAELALYVLPRAVESVLGTLLHRRLLPNVPLWEVAVFAFCMGSLMYYREREPDTLAPFLGSLISRIVLGQGGKKVVPTVRSLQKLPGTASEQQPVPECEEVVIDGPSSSAAVATGAEPHQGGS